LAGVLAAGSRLLLGFDRAAHAGKPAAVIRAAYDDEAGVTAQFNLNVLAHLNRALGSDFQRSAWRHVARYDEGLDRIEMHLESAVDQVVTFPDGPRFAYRAGQRILTEISRKFDPDGLAAWFEPRGFRAVEHWADEREYFGLMLLERL
ncbi:MAG: L-histidine N(alpha)-methyltransferase, partial [Candidatus Sericytochromatia bacterium]